MFALATVVAAGCTAGESSSEVTPSPTPTVTQVAATASATPSASATSTVEATATVTPSFATSVPTREEARAESSAPNPQPVRSSSGPALGAKLTIYNCVGSTGAVYCPWGSHTASGTVVAPGTAACDSAYLGRRFQVIGDRAETVWTCLDTGNFAGNLFDLWFYDLADGRAYLNNLPYPYQVSFVD